MRHSEEDDADELKDCSELVSCLKVMYKREVEVIVTSTHVHLTPAQPTLVQIVHSRGAVSELLSSQLHHLVFGVMALQETFENTVVEVVRGRPRNLVAGDNIVLWMMTQVPECEGVIVPRGLQLAGGRSRSGDCTEAFQCVVFTSEFIT